MLFRSNGFNTFFRVAGSTGFKFLNPNSSNTSAGETLYQVVPGSPSSLSILLNPSFVFGEPFPVRGEITVSARAGAGGFYPFVGEGTADFSHTAFWGGVGALTLEDGSVVTDFTVLDSNGLSWTGAMASVPEAGSLSMILGAAGAMAIASRRRRR